MSLHCNLFHCNLFHCNLFPATLFSEVLIYVTVKAKWKQNCVIREQRVFKNKTNGFFF